MATRKKPTANFRWPEPDEPKELTAEQKAEAQAAFKEAQRTQRQKRRASGIRRDRMPTNNDAAAEVKRLVAEGMPKADAVKRVRAAVLAARKDVAEKKGEG